MRLTSKIFSVCMIGILLFLEVSGAASKDKSWTIEIVDSNGSRMTRNKDGIIISYPEVIREAAKEEVLVDDKVEELLLHGQEMIISPSLSLFVGLSTFSPSSKEKERTFLVLSSPLYFLESSLILRSPTTATEISQSFPKEC